MDRQKIIKTCKITYYIDPVTNCWVWEGCTNEKGYGLIEINRIAKKVHIISYILHKGPISEELELDHLCRNRKCLNPNHLEPVTHAENVRRGSRAKLNYEKVKQIKESVAIKGMTKTAMVFGVSLSTVSRIMSGERWGKK